LEPSSSAEKSLNLGIKKVGNGETRHHWHFSDLIIQPIHCNVCHSLLLTTKGQYCSNCGIGSCLSPACIQKANSIHICKEVACTPTVKQVAHSENHQLAKPANTAVPENGGDGSTSGKSESPSRILPRPRFRHHWINGNLPLNSECEVCEDVCGDGTGIVDMKCCWCQRTVHNKCQQQLSDLCDMGEFKRFIVPPFCVKTCMTRKSIMQRYSSKKVISHIESPELDNWTPVFVIGNRKSGNNDGAALLPAFRGCLNPAQVTDLSDSSMHEALELLQRLSDPNVQPLCAVAGGDGTVGWVLNSIDELRNKARKTSEKSGLPCQNFTDPTLVLVPLGTGNDLARSLGYGPGLDASANVKDILRRLSKESKRIMLDRWKVVVNPRKLHFGITLPSQEIYMQNYLSIGVDALVTYNFHKARESPFYVMSSRLINKFIYFSYGTKDVLERECRNLNKILDLYMDGEKVELPDIESVVVLNIPCWGAGVRPWSLGQGHENFPPPSMSDKKLEVFCVYSSFHIAQMQVGLSEPFRVGQAHKVEIILRGSAPMQTDGEPWEQHPATITVDHHRQVPVLSLEPETFTTGAELDE